MITSGKQIRMISSIILGLAVALSGCAGPGTMHPPKDVGPPPEVLNETAYHHFSNGTILMLDKNFSAAAAELEKALSYEPDSREIRISLGECYFNLREFEKAVTVVSVIAAKDGKTWDLLAKYYRNLDRQEEAYRAYQEVLRLDSGNTEAYRYLVGLEMRRGRMEEAVKLMEKLAEVRLSVRTMTGLGRVYWQAGQFDKATETLHNVIDGVYGSPSIGAFELLADVYGHLGQPQKTVSTLQKAKVLFPHEARLQEKLVDALIAGRRYDEAAEELLALLKQRRRPQDRIRLAALYFQAGRYDESDSLFTIATQTDPDDYLPHLYLGRLKMIREQHDSAKVHLARAVEIDDEKPDAYLSWAGALLAQDSIRQGIRIAREGEFVARPRERLQFLIGVTYSRLEVYDSAIFWLERALHGEPSDLGVRFSLGAAYERAGRFDNADSMFQTVIAVDSNHAAALNYLGYMYAERDTNLETSLRLIERALQIEPDNAAYLDSYAWVLFKLGRVEEAQVQIRRAIEHATREDPVIYDHFGDILARLGRIEQARQHWAKALELDPDNGVIKEKLQSTGP